MHSGVLCSIRTIFILCFVFHSLLLAPPRRSRSVRLAEPVDSPRHSNRLKTSYFDGRWEIKRNFVTNWCRDRPENHHGLYGEFCLIAFTEHEHVKCFEPVVLKLCSEASRRSVTLVREDGATCCVLLRGRAGPNRIRTPVKTVQRTRSRLG